MKTIRFNWIMMLAGILLSCARQEELKIISQKTGIIQTNCYLLYGADTKEAALIDVGGPIDSLLTAIQENGLKLKYILFTHCHQDHAAGVPAIKALFPDVKLRMSREEFEDFGSYTNWEELFAKGLVDAWKKNQAMVDLMNFDYSKLGNPEPMLEDNQILDLGKAHITVLRTPGHSRGSLSFSFPGALISGDLILYHATGYIDYPLASRDRIVESARRLYAQFPDETILYTGHGDRSTIGYEKIHNSTVTQDKVNW